MRAGYIDETRSEDSVDAATDTSRIIDEWGGTRDGKV